MFPSSSVGGVGGVGGIGGVGRPGSVPLLTLSVSLALPSFSPSTLASVANSLLQSVLAQRMQMPLQWEVLKKEINREMEVQTDKETEDKEIPHRLRVKRAKERLQRQRKRERFVKAANEFVNKFENLLECLRGEVEAHAKDIECISFLLGSTPVTPREVYHLFPPKNITEDENESQSSASASKRATLQLFRAMVTHDTLFERMGKRMMATNVFVAIKKIKRQEILPVSSWLIPKPEFSNLQRGKVTEFRLNCCAPPPAPPPPTRKCSVEPRRRILFGTPLGAERPPVTNAARTQHRKVTYTPVPMEMCTPHPAKMPCNLLEDETPLKPLCVEMIETPCAIRKTPWRVRRAAADSGAENATPMVTPLFERKRHVSDEREKENRRLDCHGIEKLCLEELSYEWYISAEPIKGFKDPRVSSKQF